jgi:allantoicase
MTNFTDLIDLAAERLGGAALIANDEFFAPKESLLRAAPAVWKEGEYTDRGKWMDGWETRRRRAPGHDWCIIRLGLPGTIHGVVVDTAYFRGNYPESCSVEVASVPGTPHPETLAAENVTQWTTILPKSPLKGDAKNEFAIPGGPTATHVRLTIYPDGGVARFRVFGEPAFDPNRVRAGSEIDLAAMENGGLVVSCSDMFFGHRHNLILPGRSTHMGDGWETKRRRGPGNDWSVIRLAARGILHRIEIDTDHFKGNAPGSAILETVDARGSGLEEPRGGWQTLLPKEDLQPHTRHRFDVSAQRPATHARLSIYPDGGIARLRLYGMLA